MSEFKNVTIVMKANVYFDGRVTSRTILFPDGSQKTLGIMLPGDYEFGTDTREFMELLTGDLEVLLPGNDDWKTLQGHLLFHLWWKLDGRPQTGLPFPGSHTLCRGI